MPTARRLSALLCLAASLLCAGSASAHISGIRPEAHLNLGYRGDLGVGFRVDIPIVPQGFLDSSVDELALSPGADLLFDDGEIWVGVPIALQWNFYIDREWSFFPELGLAFLFGHHHRWHRGDDGDLGIDLLLAVGGRYHLSSRNALVLRVGWPIGVQFGITF